LRFLWGFVTLLSHSIWYNVESMIPSKAKEAAFALALGWNSPDSASWDCPRLSEMRKAAIDAISLFGIANNSVYENLEKSFFNNLNKQKPDFEEIRKTLNALTELNTTETVNLLYKFLCELHGKRDSCWGDKENQAYTWVVNSLRITHSTSRKIMKLLYDILRSEIYSRQERLCAKDALIEIREHLTG